VPLVVSYGLSEATCTSTMNPPDGRKIGTIGTVLADQDVRVFDPVTHTEVAQGGEGEIRIAGPALMAGYLGSAEQPIVDGWLRTGDLESSVNQLVPERVEMWVQGAVNGQDRFQVDRRIHRDVSA